MNFARVPILENWAMFAGFVAVLIITVIGSLYWGFGDYILHLPECPVSGEKYYECLLVEYTRQLSFFTKALFAATLTLAVVTLYFGWRQFQDTRILQRAYLSVEPRGLHEMKNDKTIIAYVAFINRGNLPASNVQNEVKIKWFEDGNKADFEAVEIVDPGAVIMLPRDEIERGTNRLSDEDADKYRAEKGFVFVWGRVQYKDGFGRDRWRIFCHRYNCTKPDVFRHHHHHNAGN